MSKLDRMKAWLDVDDYLQAEKTVLKLVEQKRSKALAQLQQGRFQNDQKRDRFLQMVNQELSKMSHYVEETRAYLFTLVELLEERETHIILLKRQNQALQNQQYAQGTYPVSPNFPKSMDERRADQTIQYRKWTDHF